MFAAGILIIVFVILITFTVITTKSSLNQAIFGEFNSMARDSGHQVQSILDSAYSVAESMQSYLQKAYQFSENGKRNLLGQEYRTGETKETITNSGMFISSVYNKKWNEMSSDVEKYILETAKNTILNNEDVTAVGVMFEPYQFDTTIDNFERVYMQNDLYPTMYTNIINNSLHVVYDSKDQNNGANTVGKSWSEYLAGEDEKNVFSAGISAGTDFHMSMKDKIFMKNAFTIRSKQGIVHGGRLPRWIAVI